MTALPDTLDAARVVDGTTLYDEAYMRSVDEQIRALGGDVVTQRGLTYSWCRPVADPDGDALPMGVAVATKPGTAALVMQRATAANLAAGSVLLGVLTEATPVGARGRVAVGGVVPATVTGVTAPGAIKFARAEVSVARIEVMDALTFGDVVLGTITPSGDLVMQMASPSAINTAAPAVVLYVQGRVPFAFVLSPPSLHGQTPPVSSSGAGVYDINLTGLEIPFIRSFNCVGNVTSNYEAELMHGRIADSGASGHAAVRIYDAAGAPANGNFVVSIWNT